jgi:hypothetical protein
MQSRREFLIGSGAVLGTALPQGAVAALIADAALLASLSPSMRELTGELLAAYPALTLASAVAMLSEGGM